MMSSKLSLKDNCKLIVAWCLVKLGKLTHDDFSKQELQSLVDGSFPYTFTFEIPIGTGTVNVLEGKVTLDESTNRIGLQCLASLTIVVASNTIYRAHVIFALSTTPCYVRETKTVCLNQLRTDAITLVNDDYALIKDTHYLLSRFFPRSVNSLLSGSLKSALSLFTAGTSDMASDYLKLYLSGSKQAILDYHKPQIDAAIRTQISEDKLCHELSDEQWREVLFSKRGESVRVEGNVLRFYLA